MVRSALKNVMWVGRATVFLVGLAVILAIVFGVASTAFAHGGHRGLLHLGHSKTAKAVTTLVGKVATGEALVVKNPSGGSALGLNVGDPAANPATKTVAPMKVDSQAKVANLNADRLDGIDSTGFVQGKGSVMHSTVTLAPDGNTRDVLRHYQSPDIDIEYTCPTNLSNNGTLLIRNWAVPNVGETINVFSDNGSADPNAYVQLGYDQHYSQPAYHGGEHITLRAQGAGMGTIEVFSVHRANDCLVQAQGLFTYP